MDMCLRISIYYQEDRQEFGLFLAGREVPIAQGGDAESMFNNLCSKLEDIGFLGAEIVTLDNRKAYLIEKD